MVTQQMEKDAERYRYLRDQWLGYLLKLFDTTDMSDVGLDAAIDDAATQLALSSKGSQAK